MKLEGIGERVNIYHTLCITRVAPRLSSIKIAQLSKDNVRLIAGG